MKNLLLLLMIALASCTSSKKDKGFQPEILDSDRIVTCYCLAIRGNGTSLEEYMGIAGNLLLSQNNIAKAFQVNYDTPEWFKVESFIFDTNATTYQYGNQTFRYCVSLKLLKQGEIWNFGKVYYN